MRKVRNSWKLYKHNGLYYFPFIGSNEYIGPWLSKEQASKYLLLHEVEWAMKGLVDKSDISISALVFLSEREAK
tara:strand:- start:438 stop:659 length:222 start_codon:yes stop_codon:yes gene_type:complete